MIKLKTLALIVSLALNGLVILSLVVTASSKANTASLSLPAVSDGYMAAATVAVLPAASPLVFNPVEITLKPDQTACLQYSVLIAHKQSNIFVSALYDPQIIAIEYTDSGIIITALRDGETLMQYIANDGIKDLVRISVTK